MEKAKILIIDDDPFIMDMYVMKFRNEGYTIEVAKDGKEGLKKIEEFNPDVVLLDIVIPQMDGFSVLKEVKKSNNKVKIILLTNLGQKGDVERGMQLGAKDYIIKAHFTPSEVVQKVKEILQK